MTTASSDTPQDPGPPPRTFSRARLSALLREEATRVNASAEVGADPIVRDGDATLLRHMIRNLLENARKHGGPGPVDATLTRTDDGATLTVCDRGPGVPEGERERIFAPFYRPRFTQTADDATAKQGAGLGLALVRQVARFHDATVTCQPRDGGGTVFEVRFGP